MALQSPYEYNFSHKKRGDALIICNGTFNNLPNRASAEADLQRLTETFKHLGFTVRGKSNLTASAMEVELTKVSRGNHADADCVVVAVSSHGEQTEPQLQRTEKSTVTVNTSAVDGRLLPAATQDISTKTYKTENVVFGTDGSVPVKTVMEYFCEQKCPSLTGKPKIFIFQCCRASSYSTGFMETVTIPANGQDLDDDITRPGPRASLTVTSADQPDTRDGGEAGDSEDAPSSVRAEDTIDAQPIQASAGSSTTLPDLSQLSISEPAALKSGQPAVWTESHTVNQAQSPQRPSITKLPNMLVRNYYKEIPHHRDFISIHAVPDGYYAFNTPDGSPFIKYLCKELVGRHLEDDLASILRNVSYESATQYKTYMPSKPSQHQRQFVPCVEDMLLKEIYFRPKNPSS